MDIWLTLHYMLTRSSEAKLKNAKKNNEFKYHVWYKMFLKKENTCVITLVMIYENKKTNPMKVFRVLSCVLYYVINSYVCVDHLCFQYKNLSVICYDKTFMGMSYN